MPDADVLTGGRYRLGPAIGSGGMGTVRRARDVRFDRDVAVKLLRTAADPRQQERMRREARLLGALQHPNLVTAYDTGIDLTPDGPQLWLAMELVRGPDLGVLLARQGRLGSEDVRRIVQDVGAALAALHAAGVVHRDLKPANLLLTREPGPRPWQVKVADLGIALTEDAAAMTTTGQVMGTAAYLSPEQVAGEPVDAASDVYSLGLLALVALTGEHPFPGGPVESATARLVRPPDLPSWITGGWRMLLEAMTSVDPALRPSAEQVAAATASPLPVLVAADPAPLLLDDGGPTVAAETMPPTAVLPIAPAPTPRRARRLLPLGAAVAVVLGLLGGGVALIGTAASPQHAASAGHVTARPTASRTPAPATARSTPVPSTTAAPVSSHHQQTKAAPRPAPGHGKHSQKGPARGKGHGKG